MSIIQILLVIGAISSLFIYLRYFRSIVFDRLIALGLFVLALIFILFPYLTTRIANFVGVGRGADLLLYLLFVISIFLFLALYFRLARLEDRLTKLVRDLAVAEVKKPGEN